MSIVKEVQKKNPNMVKDIKLKVLDKLGEIKYEYVHEKEDSQKYKDFVKATVKKEGYESFADIPKDKIDDFWKVVDKGWNSEDEAGKDGEVTEAIYYQNDSVTIQIDKDNFIEIYDNKEVIAYPKKQAQRGLMFKNLKDLNSYISKYFDIVVSDSEYKKIESKILNEAGKDSFMNKIKTYISKEDYNKYNFKVSQSKKSIQLTFDDSADAEDYYDIIYDFSKDNDLKIKISGDIIILNEATKRDWKTIINKAENILDKNNLKYQYVKAKGDNSYEIALSDSKDGEKLKKIFDNYNKDAWFPIKYTQKEEVFFTINLV